MTPPTWLDASGREMADDTWNSPGVRCLGVRLNGDAIDEIDVNPVIVHPEGCVAVDALVVGRRQAAGSGIVKEIRT